MLTPTMYPDPSNKKASLLAVGRLILLRFLVNQTASTAPAGIVGSAAAC